MYYFTDMNFEDTIFKRASFLMGGGSSLNVELYTKRVAVLSKRIHVSCYLGLCLSRYGHLKVLYKTKSAIPVT